ncbi:MAG: mannose-6-phosphate isomerase, class I [Ruminococcaceae bacterium]|nr:mannose-6-phosphate isomerase, class I [Oscillospiraceae bacterium]
MTEVIIIFLLTPVFKDYIWGGNRLKTDFGFENDLEKTAEAWVLSCHKDGENTVKGGRFDGKRLSEVLTDEMLGENGKKFDFFPILIKLIDAKNNLSLQVHPDNEYALKNEHEFGKTECWYILDCEEDAELIYGFKEDISSEEFRQSIENDTVLDKVNHVKVKKGDFFFIESGTLHAIGKGILLAEIQQNSNTTYRVYDYNRLGADGKPRPLHIDKAVDVTVCKKPTHSALPEGETEKNSDFEKTLLTSNELFKVTRFKTEKGTRLFADEKSFVSLLVLDGKGEINNKNETLNVKKGDSVFIPASSGEITVKGKLEFLETTV